jgi:hypothetical protein
MHNYFINLWRHYTYCGSSNQRVRSDGNIQFKQPNLAHPHGTTTLDPQPQMPSSVFFFGTGRSTSPVLTNFANMILGTRFTPLKEQRDKSPGEASYITNAEPF